MTWGLSFLLIQWAQLANNKLSNRGKIVFNGLLRIFLIDVNPSINMNRKRIITAYPKSLVIVELSSAYEMSGEVYIGKMGIGKMISGLLKNANRYRDLTSSDINLC